jgi:hypothetical protein
VRNVIFYHVGYNGVWSFESHQISRRYMSFPSSGSKNKRSRKPEWKVTSRACWFLAWLIRFPWRWMRHVPPKRLLIFIELHEVISQKTEIFVTTAVRDSNPKKSNVCYSLSLLTVNELTLSIKGQDICVQDNFVSDFHVVLMHTAYLKTLLVHWFYI